MNHPFVDGNKRAGIAAGFALLESNWFVVRQADDHWAAVAVDTACHRVGQDELAAIFAETMGGDCPIEIDDP
jgi:prophage maintenance system killer protein